MPEQTETQSGAAPIGGPKGTHPAMIACCALVLLAVAGVVAPGITPDTGPGTTALGWAPFVVLAICAGFHLAMHRKMGEKCHISQSARSGQGRVPNPAPPASIAHSIIAQVKRL